MKTEIANALRKPASKDSVRSEAVDLQHGSGTSQTYSSRRPRSLAASAPVARSMVHTPKTDVMSANHSAMTTPWLTVPEAADRARCGIKTIYREVRATRLRAARVGGRRELRFLSEWVDAWLFATMTIR